MTLFIIVIVIVVIIIVIVIFHHFVHHFNQNTNLAEQKSVTPLCYKTFVSFGGTKMLTNERFEPEINGNGNRNEFCNFLGWQPLLPILMLWLFSCQLHRSAQIILPKLYLVLTVVSSLLGFLTQFPIPHFIK